MRMHMRLHACNNQPTPCAAHSGILCLVWSTTVHGMHAAQPVMMQPSTFAPMLQKVPVASSSLQRTMGRWRLAMAYMATRCCCSLQVDTAPDLLRPAGCLESKYPELVDRNKEPDIIDWEPYCKAANETAADGKCTADKITRPKPLLKCSYRSLSNFYQMQQHIRKHGAIVSRIIMNVRGTSFEWLWSTVRAAGCSTGCGAMHGVGAACYAMSAVVAARHDNSQLLPYPSAELFNGVLKLQACATMCTLVMCLAG